MGLLDYFRGTKNKIVDSGGWVNVFGGSTSSFTGLMSSRQQLDQYRGWVYACVQARAEAIGEIELKLYDKDGTEIIDHPLLDLLNKLNPRTTKGDHFAGTQSYLDLLGDSFWFLARDNNGNGSIREIYLLRPDRMRIVPSKDAANPFGVHEYVYQSGANKITFKPNQILHIPNFNPKAEHPFPYRGMSVIEAAANAIETDNETRKWNFSFFQNSAQPGGFITASKPVTDDIRTRLQKMFESRHQGGSNAHKVALLEDGMDYKPGAISQKDMDFIEQRRFSRDEILALFRVPKTAIGIVEDVNRSNAEATNYVFALRTVRPLMQRIVDYLNEFLVPEFGDGLYLDFVSPVPEDKVAESAYYAAAIDKWMTRNEIRSLEGLPKTKEGDKIMGTLAQLPIDEVIPEPKKVSSIQRKEYKKEDIKKFDIVIEIEKRSISKEVVEKYITLWKNMLDQNTKKFEKEMRAYFTEQEKEVLSNIEQAYGEKSVKRIKAVDDLLFESDDAIRNGVSLVTPFLRQWLKDSGDQATSDLLGSDTPFDPSTPVARKFIKLRGEYFAKSITDTTAQALFNTLKEGTEAGEGLVDLSKRVADVYDMARDYRTDRIARSEVSAAANEGAIEAYKQAGVEEHEWLVVNPKDEDCLVNSGEVVAIGEDFSSGVDKPPVHPNCECTTIPVFK